MIETQDTRRDAAGPGSIPGIDGAFGLFRPERQARSGGWRRRASLMLAVLGPGLIVMIGDNDAGAYGVYAEAGQNHGTALLWLLPLVVPILYLNLEMALRLGAVTGVGHARLILARFGSFWAPFPLSIFSCSIP